MYLNESATIIILKILAYQRLVVLFPLSSFLFFLESSSLVLCYPQSLPPPSTQWRLPSMPESLESFFSVFLLCMQASKPFRTKLQREIFFRYTSWWTRSRRFSLLFIGSRLDSLRRATSLCLLVP
ncbi:hypothetical protein MANES_01G016100v8 [Manihot esculenta]|uniref:Uncharacterized protein n=1 Tax=Manihot esculenta TaxID=3983 RepID=A0A2C9WIA5_MANES|nr:hypothetical protein MANES_01G016100v8 [Manihot esculenta]